MTLDSELERELGLSSLELAELVVRVQDAFGVTLPTETLTVAETPRDLLRAVRGTTRHGPGRRPGRAATGEPSMGRSVAVEPPETESTLTGVLRWYGETVPDRIHIRVLGEGGVQEELSYGALRHEAVNAAAGLLDRGLERGDKVAIMLPTDRSYFVTFMGVLLAGGVPVPVYPPDRASRRAEHLARYDRIFNNARVTSMVTGADAVRSARFLRSRVATLREVVAPGDLTASGGALPEVAGGDVALLQYTSGSTGHPKGVVLTHGELLADIRAMGQAEAASMSDILVSWLPLYHDMGLIGAWLSSLYFGVPLLVMPPQLFLSRPSRWLWAICEHQGTISASPNFGYELCLQKVTDEEIRGLDLSSWRLAFNGAEPVRADTIEGFAARFGPYGLRREAITPVYGLAEAAVGLTFPPLGRGPLLDRIEREPFLRSGRAVPAEADRSTLRFVACGRPLPGYRLHVVGDTGEELGERREGHIEFQGPSATCGYYRNPAATRSLFHGEWLDTGDLGYLVGGEVYVTGRVKDIIIRAGRNLHPEEVEEAVGKVAGVRRGCVAVFAAPDPQTGTERLVVLAETTQTDEAARAALRTRIVRAVVDLLDAAPDDVVLAAPHTVPKTSSGKIRRTGARDIYRRGAIGRWPEPVVGTRFRLLVRDPMVSRLRRARRASGAIMFAAYGWLLLIMMAGPLLALLVLAPVQRWRRRSLRAGIRLLARLTGTPITTEGLDGLPAGPWVAVANHASWLDGAALTAVLPETCGFVAAEMYARRPLSGFVLRRLGAEFVERTDREQGVRDTARLSRSTARGQQLVMFPEGRLDAVPGLRPFHMGAFVVAAHAGVPVVPIAIHGTRSILRPGRCFPRHGHVHIVVDAPIHPIGSGWKAAVHLQHAARTAILRCFERPGIDRSPGRA
ncbi:AMP-binding protein [Actinoallomurus sp. NPDC050550]|uniref:AMP-binding protein n=1 Tax=Actinoallomurus sp. NPDC050550 TaxID=3154937 RepID=UPI0033CCD9B9